MLLGKSKKKYFTESKSNETITCFCGSDSFSIEDWNSIVFRCKECGFILRLSKRKSKINKLVDPNYVHRINKMIKRARYKVYMPWVIESVKPKEGRLG